MNQILEFALPYPPSVNNYKEIGKLITTRSGKMLQIRKNSGRTLQYYCDIINFVRAQRLKSFADATISVELDVYPPDKRKRDLDGILKVCLDSMQHAGLYDDDFQIARLLVQRMHIISQGQIVVRIQEIRP